MRQINVSVVGMSGTEKDKGQIGVGKSCLCNRFVRPLTDDYFIDHISVLSQSDFSGRIVNNDHFLYWGDVRKQSDDGTDYNFHVVEQTEFVDDATFQPFKVGKMESYIKRCTATKIVSAEKLMYICKNQLGIEKEYEERCIPDGRLSIDGFICVFDVSPVPNRSIEKQVEYVQQIINFCMKNKKPIVLVTTKNDEANEQFVREAEKICQRKEYKGNVFLVETSSHEAINVDMAFLLLAQIIDKVKMRTKILSYNEASRSRKELLDCSTEAVSRLIRSQISDYHTTWNQASKMLAIHKDWQEFLELFGQEAGQRIFRRHVKKLREDNVSRRLQAYMINFNSVLHEFLPDLQTVNREISGADWNIVRPYIKGHTEYDQYFFECEQAPWMDLSDVSDCEDETRIPFDVLETPEAETVFKNHLNALQQEQKRLEWKKQFKKLLEEAGYVTPGKQLAEVRVLFMGRECFEALSEHDCQQIYDNHQKEIIERAKHNFQELLLENADLFYHFKSIEPSGTITQDDIKEITDVLQDDSRYKILDRLDQDRKLMLFQHLGFIHVPLREHCPAFPNCVDAMVERIISAKKSQSLSRNHWKQSSSFPPSDCTLNVLVLGAEQLASDIINEICLNCGDDGEYIYDGQPYYLHTRIINGSDHETFKNIDFRTSGLICVYSNQHTVEYLKDNLERSLLFNLEMEDKFECIPLVLVYQPEDQKDDNEIEILRSEGQHLAEMLHCTFIDTSLNFYHHRKSQHQNYIYNILNNIIECIRLTEHQKPDDLYQFCDAQPDIRIIVCMFCGDPFSVESILSPILSEPTSTMSSERSVIFETFMGDTKRKIEVIFSSYHGANAFRDELVHGFILLYSTKRRASLATLNAFSMNIPNLPMQLIAITDNGGANAFFNNELCQMLITEGNSVAEKLRAHFMTSAGGNQLKFTFYTPFLQEVWEKKPEIEQAFHMEEPVTLDSGEGTLEHSTHHRPQPPPRHESYLLKNADGSGSENYEHLPTRSLNSLNGGDDNNINFNLNDNNEKYPHLYMLGEKDMGIDDSYMNDDDKDDKSRLIHQGWLDDAQYNDKRGGVGISGIAGLGSSSGEKEGRRNILWNNFSSHHAFTTGRHPRQSDTNFGNKVRPKGPSQTLKQPGKLNLKNFAIVNDALARMNVNSDNNMQEGDKSRNKKLFRNSTKKSTSKSKTSKTSAPLAAPEDDSDDLAEYAQVKDVYGLDGVVGSTGPDPTIFNFTHDGTSSTSKSNSKTRHRRDKGPKYSESDSESSSSEQKNRGGLDGYYKMNRKAQTHKRMRKKRTAIPVQPPKVPFGTYVCPPEIPMLYQKMKTETKKMSTLEKGKMYGDVQEEESSIDVSSPRDNNSPIFGVVPKLKDNDREKLLERKREKQKLAASKEEEKLEKRRAKDEAAKLRKLIDKEKELEKKMKRKSKPNGKNMVEGAALSDFLQSEKNLIPLFMEKCVEFIEQEGLDSEGIYRVPGNRAHVELLYQKLQEEPNADIEVLDIPVNAVATALKDFFSKHLPSLFEKDVMKELEEIAANIIEPFPASILSRNGAPSNLNMEVKTDRSCRLLALRGLLNKLPPINFSILKYIFQHFVRVSENSKLNSMDSKNLAICWWPTLIPIHFTDMMHFEQLRPYLEDIVQTMIDQYPFLFCDKMEKEMKMHRY
ncbi:rho GTPase-activating protein 190 isoform X10 [Sitodiplosis mosellana]|uniref:rho GTPase-activating protein 190 isoform X10 n=1 Tax=Sitodiplosis mosellana TaxID=263140 RepID=UPI00244504D5|nr:rho GTPase-activating protein 190 isoform X10 [Sitodiplosis mosellana]